MLLLSAAASPAGAKSPSFQAAAGRLQQLLGTPVPLLSVPTDGQPPAILPGQVALVENLSRLKGEAAGDSALALKLAQHADLFVNDAPRGTVGGGMSVDVLPSKLPSYAGLALHRELEVVSELASRKHNPLVAIFGGRDLPGSITLARRLMSGHNLKQLFVAGAIAYTFLRSRLVPIGRSLSDSSLQVEAFQIIERSELSDVALQLPVDHVVADRFGRDSKCKTVGRMDIPEAWIALDAGPKTVSVIEKAVKKAGAVLWHGPLGALEDERFARGTLAVAKALSKSGALSVAVGDSLTSLLHAHGYGDRISHLAQSSRLVLELLAGKTPVGVSVLGG